MPSRNLIIKTLQTTTIILTSLMAGCVLQTATVPDDTLAQRAAFALGTEKDDVTISNRMDEGEAVRFQVAVKDGQRYNCTIGRPPAMFGQPLGSVSDAICTQVGKSSGSGGTCNALLKAAGKC